MVGSLDLVSLGPYRQANPPDDLDDVAEIILRGEFDNLHHPTYLDSLRCRRLPFTLIIVRLSGANYYVHIMFFTDLYAPWSSAYYKRSSDA